MMRRRVLVGATCAAWLAFSASGLGPADAAPVTVGLFAPSAPFPSTAARVALASRLGSELGAALRQAAESAAGSRGDPGATALDVRGRGAARVYARAQDFAAAVRSGAVTLAVVDPAYLAGAGGSYTVLAVAVAQVGGRSASERAWQVVAPAGTALAGLEGKRAVVPSLGGREAELVTQALFGGELGREFFAAIEPAPDTASALAALGLGKADAAVVPVTDELPPGTAAIAALPALPTPVLVVYGAMSAQDREAVVAAATAFTGDATIAGFVAADASVVRSVARRFAPPAKRAPFATPVTRLVAGELVTGRRFAIERTPAAAFAIAPAPR